jgi:hypothetical protein
MGLVVGMMMEAVAEQKMHPTKVGREMGLPDDNERGATVANYGLMPPFFSSIKLTILIKMSAWCLFAFISVIDSIIFVSAPPWSVCIKYSRF